MGTKCYEGLDGQDRNLVGNFRRGRTLKESRLEGRGDGGEAEQRQRAYAPAFGRLRQPVLRLLFICQFVDRILAASTTGQRGHWSNGTSRSDPLHSWRRDGDRVRECVFGIRAAIGQRGGGGQDPRHEEGVRIVGKKFRCLGYGREGTRGHPLLVGRSPHRPHPNGLPRLSRVRSYIILNDTR